MIKKLNAKKKKRNVKNRYGNNGKQLSAMGNVKIVQKNTV